MSGKIQGLLVVSAILSLANGSGYSTKPNIVIILIDDMVS